MNQKNNAKGYLYILPAVLIIIVFTLYPLVRTFAMSFMVKYNPFKGYSGWGIGNYTYIFGDKDFLRALKNTLIFVAFVVPISISISLLIAVLINGKIKCKGAFQTMYFMPYVTSTIAIGIVWRWIFNSDFGLLNYFLSIFGVEPVQWLNDKSTALTSLIIFAIWKSLAFDILIFLAGLQNISQEYYNAAKVDATPRWRVFTKITVPLLSPMILYAFIMGFISSFKVYNEVVALYGNVKAGPGNSAITMVYYIYDQFYNNNRYGLAAAAAVVLFLIILLLTFIQMRVSKNRVHY